MKRKDWFIKYSLEFIVIVLGISVSFWLNQVSTNKQNNNERIKILNSLQKEAKEINDYLFQYLMLIMLLILHIILIMVLDQHLHKILMLL